MKDQRCENGKDNFIDGAIKVKTGHEVNNKPLGVVMIIVAAVVVVCTVASTIFTWMTMQNSGEINGKLGLPLAMVFGVRNGNEGVYTGRVDAEPGQEIDAEMLFYNTSGTTLDLSTYMSLPPTLEFVPGSAKLFSGDNPDGIDVDVDLSAEWVDLGAYQLYNAETGNGSGALVFKVRVSENQDLFQPGKGALNMAAEIAGYQDGHAVTDTIYCYATVDVTVDNQ